MSEHRTSGTGSGLLLPTPLTIAVSTEKAEQTYFRDLERVGSPTWQSVLAVAARKWPTPIASDSRGSSGKPTPGKQVQLVDAVRRVATPTARDWKSGKASDATMERNSRPLSEQIGGSLNPTWVEWLMGWPLGWTDLKPLATDRFLCAPPERGDCFQAA